MMKFYLWKYAAHTNPHQKKNEGFRHRSQISHNLEVPIEEEPETLELAVRTNEDVEVRWPDETKNFNRRGS